MVSYHFFFFSNMVDRSGEIRFMHRGYKPGYEDLYERQVRALIKE